MTTKIAILPGDGIGPEVTAQAIAVLETVSKKHHLSFELKYADIGAIAIDRHGSPLPKSTIQLCLESNAVLLGAIGDPKYDDPNLKSRPEDALFALRKNLQLFSNIRPITSNSKLLHVSAIKPHKIKNVNFLIIRELLSGIYFGERRLVSEDEAFDKRTYRRFEIERIAHLAFRQAQKRQKKVTLIDKANILETCRLWRKVVKQISLDYPDVTLEYMYIDNAGMQIIINPGQFDVILASNLFGDVISDIAGVIGGSIGMLPSSSIGDKYALFEPVHGSYPQATGQDIANPIGAILSVSMMLEHLGHHKAVIDIENAIEKIISEYFLTKDLNEYNSQKCSAVGNRICEYIQNS